MSVLIDLFPGLPDPCTKEQAVEAIHVSERTLNRWIANGDLPAYTLGSRRVLIRKEDLIALAHRVGDA